MSVYLLKLCPNHCDLSTKCVCASCQVCVKCRRANRTVYTRRHGVTSEVAGGHDWLPGTSSLSSSHGDTVPEDTLSICFTTHGHSHTHSSEGHRRYGRQPHAQAHSCMSTHKSQFSSSRESVWPRWPGWTLAHPHWFITPHSLAPRCLLAGGPSCRVMRRRRGKNWRKMEIFGGKKRKKKNTSSEELRKTDFYWLILMTVYFLQSPMGVWKSFVSKTHQRISENLWKNRRGRGTLINDNNSCLLYHC